MLLVALAACLVAGVAPARAAAPPPEATLRIGITGNPPLAMRTPGGTWTGLVPDIWNAIGRREHLHIDYVPVGGDDVASLLAAGRIDVGPAMTLSGARVERMAFTPPILATGLAMVTVEDRGWNWRAMAHSLWASGLIKVLGGIVLLNVLIGALLWAVERKRNPGNFGGDAAQGFASGIWCSIATMMTVGYGDRVPVTWAGRALCFVIMLSGVIIVSLFTAAATSALTVAHLHPRVHDVHDLAHVVSVAIAGSDGAAYLRRHALPRRTVPDLAAATEALARGEAAAFVDDRLELRAAFSRAAGRYTILPLNLEEEFVAFPVTAEPGRQRRIDVALQKFLDSDAYDRIDAAYLGD